MTYRCLALLHDTCPNGLPEWEMLYCIDTDIAKHNSTTIVAEIERQIKWEVGTCGRDIELLAVAEILKPMPVRGKVVKKLEGVCWS